MKEHYYKIRCFTNIDEYKEEEWPRRFISVPREGDRVRSKKGRILWVVSVTHGENPEPEIVLELHKMVVLRSKD